MTDFSKAQIQEILDEGTRTGDERLVTLAKMIQRFREREGVLERKKQIHSHQMRSAQGNGFVNGVRSVRRLFPSLPKLTIDRENQTVEIENAKTPND